MTSIQRMAEVADAKTAAEKRRKPGGRGAVQVKVDRALRVAGVVPPAEGGAKASGVVASMPAAGIKFLMKIDAGMSARLEAERRRRGLRSRVETIRAVLEEAVSK